MTEREDELAWHERVLDKKVQELNAIKEAHIVVRTRLDHVGDSSTVCAALRR